MYRHTASPVSLWPKVSGLRSGCPSSNLSVCFADSSPSRGASGEEARLCGMPRPPLGRSNGDDRRQRRKQGGAVGAAASRMRATAKQTLGAATRAVARRQAVTERLSSARASRSGCPLSNLSVSLRSTAPLVGEPLAKRQSFAECQGLPSLGEVARRQP